MPVFTNTTLPRSITNSPKTSIQPVPIGMNVPTTISLGPQRQIVCPTTVIPQQTNLLQSIPITQSLNTPQLVGSTIQQGQSIRGESRIEYVPFERTITEYEQVRRQVQVPVTRQVTEYQAIQYEIDYIPQTIQEKVVEYVPVERYQERVEYSIQYKQNVIQSPTTQEYQINTQPQVIQQQPIQYYQQQIVQQPITTQRVVAQPITTQSYIQQPTIARTSVPQTVRTPVHQPLVIQQAVQQSPPTLRSVSPRVSTRPGLVNPRPVSYLPAQKVISTTQSYVPAGKVSQIPNNQPIQTQQPTVTAMDDKKAQRDKQFLDKLFL